MIKRLAAAALILTNLFSAWLGTAYAYGTRADFTTLISEDFSDGSNQLHGSISAGASAVVSFEGNSCLQFSKNSETELAGYYSGKPFTSGRYKLSFDLYCGGTSAGKYLRFYSADASNMSNFANAPITLALNTAGMKYIRREDHYAIDQSLKSEYQTNTWMSVEVWMDLDNQEMLYYIDGKKYAELPLMEELSSFRGFAICKEGTLEDDLYLDNVFFGKEKNSVSNGFSPLFVQGTTDAVGNNFYSDQPPQFEITMKNRTGKAVSGSYYCRAVTANHDFYENRVGKKEDDQVVWSSSPEAFLLNPQGTLSFSAEVKRQYFGRMRLEVVAEIGGREYVKAIPYTMSNHTAAMPTNHKVGVAAHFGRLEGGDYQLAIPLMQRAGIGALRNHGIIDWPTAEPVLGGDFVFTEKMDDFLNVMQENDVEYTHLYTENHSCYADPGASLGWLPAENSASLNRLGQYMSALTEFANGRIKNIELWNEWHNYEMTHEYLHRYDLFARMHKIVYNTVKAKDPNVRIAGLDSDFSMYIPDGGGTIKTIQEIKKLEDADGVKTYYDAATIHPYSQAGVAPEVSDQIVSQATKLNRALSTYGGKTNIPLLATEMGWADSQLGYDREKQAAYLVRTFPYMVDQNLYETAFLYCFLNYPYITTSESEASYGLLEGCSTNGTEIPYLGKPSYVALAYYNSLMSGAEYLGRFDTGLSDSFGYRFHTLGNQDVLMLGTTDDRTEQLRIKTPGSNSITLSDLYGNEKTLYSPNQVFELELSGLPVYVLAENLEGTKVTKEQAEHSLAYAVLDVEAPYGTEICYDVYQPGYCRKELSAENFGEILCYRNQTTAAASGVTEIVIPLADSDGRAQKAYVGTGGTEVVEYTLCRSGNSTIAIREADGTCTAKLEDFSGEEQVMTAVYSQNRFIGLSMFSKTGENTYTGKLNTKDCTELRILRWSSIESMNPTVDRICFSL